MIVVEGTIKGKARPRVTKKGITYTPKDTVNYENWVKLCYQKQDNRFIEGAIRARIIVYYKIPKSYTKKRVQAIREGLEYPCKKPDIDNCIKIILDSLNRIAYKDDSQIVEVIAVKKWTEGIERLGFSLEEIKQGN